MCIGDIFYRNGKLPYGFTGHVVYPNGDHRWYLDGRLHREDGPAVIWADGGREWWENGKLLRSEVT